MNPVGLGSSLYTIGRPPSGSSRTKKVTTSRQSNRFRHRRCKAASRDRNLRHRLRRAVTSLEHSLVPCVHKLIGAVGILANKPSADDNIVRSASDFSYSASMYAR